MAYSVDFRKRVISQIESGMSWTKACSVYLISRGTLSNWFDLYRQTGKLDTSPRKEYKVRKIESSKLFSILERMPDLTLEEVAAEFKCTPTAIFKRCTKLGITRKKNHALRRKK